MKTLIGYILILFLFLGFAVVFVLAQDFYLQVYDAEGAEIDKLDLWEIQESQYVLLEDISKLFGGTRKNEPLFGRMTLILMENRIVVTKELNRVKVNNKDENISKPAQIISGKLAVPIDFLTKIISKAIDKRIVLDLDAGILDITEDPFGSEGIYNRRRSVYRVMIDPGHGGFDTGAKSKAGLQEKDLTLEVARKIKEILYDREGIEVFLTRSEDKYMTLDERVEFANNLRGNVFLSIHFNASPSENSKGFNICINNQRMQTSNTDSSTSDMGMFVVPSRRFAGEIKTRMGQIIATGGRDREVPLSLMNGLFMPSVLIEVLHLTNLTDLEIMSRPDFIDSVAMALAESILAFGRTTTEQAKDKT